MVLKFNVSNFAIVFKIALSELTIRKLKTYSYLFTILKNVSKRLEKFLKKILMNLNEYLSESISIF